MNTLELKTDLMKYILNIEDKVTLTQLWEYIKKNTAKTKPKNLSQYRGRIKTGLTIPQIDQQLNDIRNEWERDIY
jgi:hypothetical protein